MRQLSATFALLHYRICVVVCNVRDCAGVGVRGLAESWSFSRSQFFSLEVGDNAALLGKKGK